jgi:hypothetical protein
MVNWVEVEQAATGKYQRRGGFDHGVGMYAVPIKPPPPEASW